jgi:hypothetical protein
VSHKCPTITGSVDDPEFRRERARLGAAAINSVDGLIDRLVRKAPRLTEAQTAKLRSLLADTDGGARTDA